MNIDANCFRSENENGCRAEETKNESESEREQQKEIEMSQNQSDWTMKTTTDCRRSVGSSSRRSS